MHQLPGHCPGRPRPAGTYGSIFQLLLVIIIRITTILFNELLNPECLAILGLVHRLDVEDHIKWGVRIATYLTLSKLINFRASSLFPFEQAKYYRDLSIINLIMWFRVDHHAAA